MYDGAIGIRFNDHAASLSNLLTPPGRLLGLAVGDALGTTVEFAKPGTFDPVTDSVGGGPFRLAPGEWTDDTSVACAWPRAWWNAAALIRAIR